MTFFCKFGFKSIIISLSILPMKTLVYFIAIFVVSQAFAQDTLFLKNGEKYPVIARKISFFENYIFVPIRGNEKSVKKKYNINEVKYVVTKDTTNLERLRFSYSYKLPYFRYLDSAGNHTDALVFLKRLKAEEARKRIPNNAPFLNAFIIGGGFNANGLANRGSIMVDKTISTTAESYFSILGEFVREKQNGFGFGIKFGANFGNIDFREGDQNVRLDYNSILFSLGPVYHFKYHKITIAAKLYAGIGHTDKKDFEFKGETTNYNFNISSTTFLINPSIDFYYSFQENVSFFSSIGFNIYDADLIATRITVVPATFSKPAEEVRKELPKYAIPLGFIDYRIGFKFDLN